MFLGGLGAVLCCIGFVCLFSYHYGVVWEKLLLAPLGAACLSVGGWLLYLS